MLVACFPGLLLLIATRHAVGATPIGVVIAFYTAVAWSSRHTARLAAVVMGVGLLLGLLLHPIDLSVEGLVVQVALFIGSWVIGTGTRERREHHQARIAEAERQVERERERVAFERERATRAAMEERLRITRELHDVLGHAFSVMVVQAGVAEHLLDTNPREARRALVEIGSTGRTSLAEMRRLLGILREGDTAAAPRLPAPTLAEVSGLIARVEAAGLPVSFDLTGSPVPLPAGLELAGYRVIQEALTNCIKHSGASHAQVHLTYESRAVCIEVRDDGPAAHQQSSQPGQGLAGMRERVAVYGGELSAGPAPAGGYQVRVRLPVEPVGEPAVAE